MSVIMSVSTRSMVNYKIIERLHEYVFVLNNSLMITLFIHSFYSIYSMTTVLLHFNEMNIWLERLTIVYRKHDAPK